MTKEEGAVLSLSRATPNWNVSPISGYKKKRKRFLFKLKEMHFHVLPSQVKLFTHLPV